MPEKITTNDIRTAFTLSGRADGEVVMLSHSLGSSGVMWRPQMAMLEARYRVLNVDTRGHGESDAPEGDYTLAQLARDAVALLDALDIEQVHFVGLSMGGMIGQALALDHAARLKSLVLADTMARIEAAAQPVWQARIEQARAQGMASLWPPTAERWLTASFRAQHPEEEAVIERQFEATPVAGYVGCSQAIRALDFLDELGAIAMPTVIIVGEQDTGTPVGAARAMHERIVGSQLFVIPEAAHLSNIEQPERFNAILEHHLSSVF